MPETLVMHFRSVGNRACRGDSERKASVAQCRPISPIRAPSPPLDPTATRPSQPQPPIPTPQSTPAISPHPTPPLSPHPTPPHRRTHLPPPPPPSASAPTPTSASTPTPTPTSRVHAHTLVQTKSLECGHGQAASVMEHLSLGPIRPTGTFRGKELARTEDDVLRLLLARPTDFDPVDFATAVNRLAGVTMNRKPEGGERYKQVMRLVADACDGFSARQVSEVLRDLCHLQYPPEDELIAALEKRAAEMNPTDMGMTIKAFDGLAKRSDYVPAERTLEVVSVHLRRLLPNMLVHHLPMVLHVYAMWAQKSRDAPPPGTELLRCIESELARRLPELNPKSLSSALWALAKLRHEPEPELMQELVREFGRKLSYFEPRGLANVTWAFGEMSYLPEQEVLQAMTRRIEDSLRDFSAHDLSQVCIGYGNLPHDPGSYFLHQVYAELVVKAPDCAPVTLSLTLVALAKLPHRPDLSVLQRLEREVAHKLAAFRPWSLASTLYAFGELGHQPDQELLHSLSDRLQFQLCSCAPQDLSRMLIGFAKLEHHPGQELLQKICDESAEKARQANPTTLSLVLWACGKLSFDPGKGLWRQVEYKIRHRLNDFDALNVGNILLAFGELKHHPEVDVLQMLKRRIEGLLDGSDAKGLREVLIGYANLEYPPGDAFLRRICGAVAAKAHDFNAKGLSVTWWALGKLAHHPGPEVLRCLEREVACQLADFLPQNLANTLWAFGELEHHPEPEVLQSMKQAVADRLDECKAVELSQVLIGLAKLAHHPGEAFLRCICEAVAAKAHDFNPQGLSLTWWALGKLAHHPGPEVLRCLEVEVACQLADYNPQDLTNTLWAFGELEHHPEKQLLQLIGHRIAQRLSAFNYLNLTQALTAYAKLQHDPGLNLLQRICDEAAMKACSFPPRNLALTMWAVAKLAELPYHPGSDVLQRLEHEVLCNLDDFDPQNLANTLWALGELDYTPQPTLVQSICLKMEGGEFDWIPTQLTQTLVGLAKLAHYPGETFLRCICEAVAAKAHDFNPQGLSLTWWALGKLAHHPGPEVLRCLEREVACQLADFLPRNLAITLWAFGELEHHPEPEVLQSMKQAVADRLDECKAVDLSQVLMGYAKLAHHPGEAFLRCICEAVAAKAHDFNPKGLSLTWWALGKLAHHPGPEVLRCLEREVACQLADFLPQNLAITLWAFGELEHHPEPEVLQSMNQVIERCTSEEISEWEPREWTQILIGYAKLAHHPGQALLQQICEAVDAKIHDFELKGLSLTLMALAKLPHCPGPGVLQRMEHQMAATLTDGDINFVSLGLWAFVTLEHRPNQSLLRCIEAAMTTKLTDADPRCLSQTLWACSKLNHHLGQGLLQRVGGEVERKLTCFSAQQISMTLYALALMRYNPGSELLRLMEDEAVRKLEDFEPQTLANILWAYHKLKYQSTSLCNALDTPRSLVHFRIKRFGGLALGMTMYGLGSASQTPEALLRLIEEKAQQLEAGDTGGVRLAKCAVQLQQVPALKLEARGRQRALEWEQQRNRDRMAEMIEAQRAFALMLAPAAGRTPNPTEDSRGAYVMQQIPKGSAAAGEKERRQLAWEQRAAEAEHARISCRRQQRVGETGGPRSATVHPSCVRDASLLEAVPWMTSAQRKKLGADVEGSIEWGEVMEKYLMAEHTNDALPMAEVKDNDPRRALRGEKGLFAARPLSALSVIGAYTGSVLFDPEYLQRTQFVSKLHHESYLYEIKSPEDWTDVEGDMLPSLVVDAVDSGNDLRFINDYHFDPLPDDSTSSAPMGGTTLSARAHPQDKKTNVMFLEVYHKDWPYVFVVAVDDIARDTELLISYGDDYWEGWRQVKRNHTELCDEQQKVANMAHANLDRLRVASTSTAPDSLAVATATAPGSLRRAARSLHDARPYREQSARTVTAESGRNAMEMASHLGSPMLCGLGEEEGNQKYKNKNDTAPGCGGLRLTPPLEINHTEDDLRCASQNLRKRLAHVNRELLRERELAKTTDCGEKESGLEEGNERNEVTQLEQTSAPEVSDADEADPLVASNSESCEREFKNPHVINTNFEEREGAVHIAKHTGYGRLELVPTEAPSELQCSPNAEPVMCPGVGVLSSGNEYDVRYGCLDPGDGERHLGRALVVYWKDLNAWYDGKVRKYNSQDDKHEVLYSDGDVEWLLLREQRFMWLSHPRATRRGSGVGVNAIREGLGAVRGDHNYEETCTAGPQGQKGDSMGQQKSSSDRHEQQVVSEVGTSGMGSQRAEERRADQIKKHANDRKRKVVTNEVDGYGGKRIFRDEAARAKPALQECVASGEARCQINDGKRWQCHMEALVGRKICEKHHNKRQKQKEPEYEVEDILGHTIGDVQEMRFHIKWKNYPIRESTWVPHENIKHLDILKAYARREQLGDYIGT
ncbi:hypothetical protein CYMTET_34857 [Cymbomonas tetramitiformis]|uniref:SET domain-containing protein n=1 Tax=Cymbomonas tetramitiformis TaxID=36881 RepID=A0AAE0FAE1_9CHLO|nr:hypothetical protein CYMTET_34857 [Cymbomonas tetramitiformis]